MKHFLRTTDQKRGLSDPLFLRWLCCPLCKGKLVSRTEGYFCGSCERRFPVVLGIPDFRVYPDPYISLEDDHRKGERLQAQADSLSFAELVRFYWHITPETPPDLKQRFIRHVLTDEKRAEGLLDQIPPPGEGGASCLDVGCGTGAFLRVAPKRFETVIGCDIAFRWLVVARKRLEESGTPAHLLCCCADYLPFLSNSFDSVVGICLLEHVADSQAVVQECGRVLKPSGSCLTVSTNRYSLAPEPHVRIWGVGFLPRRWMPAYVRWRKGLAYDKIRLLSCFDLMRIFRRAGFGAVSLFLPRMNPAEWEALPWFERIGARGFSVVSRFALMKWPLLLVSPLLQVVGKKRVDGAGHTTTPRK